VPSANNDVVEAFFNHDESDKEERISLPEHSLEQSPCYPIIGKKAIGTDQQTCYFCQIHPEFWTIDLVLIEHQCKYKEPEVHKQAILKALRDEQQDKCER
jgi:hypothetical protein